MHFCNNHIARWSALNCIFKWPASPINCSRTVVQLFYFSNLREITHSFSWHEFICNARNCLKNNSLEPLQSTFMCIASCSRQLAPCSVQQSELEKKVFKLASKTVNESLYRDIRRNEDKMHLTSLTHSDDNIEVYVVFSRCQSELRVLFSSEYCSQVPSIEHNNEFLSIHANCLGFYSIFTWIYILKIESSCNMFRFQELKIHKVIEKKGFLMLHVQGIS